MPRPLRILTTDRVPAYLHALATIDPALARFEAVLPDDPGPHVWWAHQRELPPSVRAVRDSVARRGLARGAYDLLLAHSVADLERFHDSRVARVLVLHDTRELLDLHGDGPSRWTPHTQKLVQDTPVVFAGPRVAASWGIEGTVVPLAVDPGLWPMSDLSRHAAVTVAPFAIERAIVDVPYLLANVSAAVPLTVLGLNPGLGTSTDTASRSRRRSAFATHRVYVNLAHPHLEGPIPSAMLEAMAAGLPVVTLRHEDSPIVCGSNGFQCDDAAGLSGRAALLLDNPALATTLGNAARQTIHDRFGVDEFAGRWVDLLGTLRAQTARRIA